MSRPHGSRPDHRSEPARVGATQEPAETRAPADTGLDDTGAVIVPYRDGPLIVRGHFTLQGPDGEEIDPGRRTVALCRCGRSALKPFCDGSHTPTRFRAPAGDTRPSPSMAEAVEDVAAGRGHDERLGA